jgi:hypothetical protein
VSRKKHREYDAELRVARESVKAAKVPLWKRTSTLLATFFTVLSGVVAAIAFIPRLSIVSSSSPLDPDKGYSNTLTITNTNPLGFELDHVNLKFNVCQMASEPLPFVAARHWCGSTGGFDVPDWQDRTLQADEPITVSMRQFIELAHVPPYTPARLSGADVAIAVSFKPWGCVLDSWPCTRTKQFRFVTRKQDSQIVWYSTPLD